MNFSGLCAFPLTPLHGESVDWPAFTRLIEKLTAAGVESIGVLGSTGCYPWFSVAERREILSVALEHAGHTPVMVSVSALRTRDVLTLTHEAQQAGASAVLLSPVSYQPLSEDEVFTLFQSVTRELSVPLCVYDNPRTTQFSFSDALLQRIAELPHVQAIKIPPITGDIPARISALRAGLPSHIRLGISGDACATEALLAGCDLWCSVTGGLFPALAARLVALAKDGHNAQAARRLNASLAPLWAFYQQHGGSLRAIATAAELTADVQPGCLPAPLQTLQGEGREALNNLLIDLGMIKQ